MKRELYQRSFSHLASAHLSFCPSRHWRLGAKPIAMGAMVIALSACAAAPVAAASSPQSVAELQSPRSTVPDGQLSQPQRAELMAKLKAAKALADTNASANEDNPILTEDFIEQSRRIDEVMQSLESGGVVRQSDLEAALDPPAFQ